MFAKNKELMGIILSEESLRMASLQIPMSSKKIAQVFRQDIRQVPEDEHQKIISSALQELKVKRPVAFCVIPPHQVTTKNIEIPSLDPQEIRSIIDLQAGRHTPYAREEVMVGYISIGVFQRNYTKVLLLIVRRDVIKKQIDTFEEAGMRINRVIFAPEAMAKFYGQALQMKEEDIPVGVINIGHQTTDFTVITSRTVAMYRNIPFGMSHLVKEGVSAQEKLAEELLHSIESYQNEDINKLPETYVLTSDDAKVKELQPLLQEKLKAQTKIIPYLDLVEAPQPVMLKLISEYNDDSFLDIIASASALDSVQVDLLPEEIRTKRTIEEKGREVVKLGISVLLILILACATFFSKIYFRGVSLDRLKKDYLSYHQKVVVLDRVAQKTRIIKGFINSRMTILDVLDELYRLIPDEIYLENITVDEDGQIVIQGVSESMSRVFNFVSALEDSGLFKSVKTTSTTAKKDRGKDAAAFEISFRLESAKDEPEETVGTDEEGSSAADKEASGEKKSE